MAILTKERIEYDDLPLVYKDDAPPREHGEINKKLFDKILREHQEHREYGSTEETYDFNNNPLTII